MTSGQTSVEFIGMIGTLVVSETHPASEPAAVAVQSARSWRSPRSAATSYDPIEDAIAYGRDLLPLVRAELARRAPVGAPA